MKTPITYYGGKQGLADEIISMIPAHKIYCEPFFGGGAVFFRKSKSYLEVINDIDDRLINFYQVTQNNFTELQYLINNTLHSEAQHRHARNVLNNSIPTGEIERAWSVWLLTNCSFLAKMNGVWKWNNGSSGSHTGVFINNKRNSFSKKIYERLRTVQISCHDAIKVILERDTPDTIFYIDPPYPGTDQGHYSGYTHIQLYELCQVLSTIQGKFILSNYFTHILKYHVMKYGWKYRNIKLSIKTSNLEGCVGSKPKTRTEILVWNFDQPRDLFS